MLGSGAGGKKPIKEAEKLRPRKPKLERVSHYVAKDKKPGAVLKGVGVGVEQARRKTGIDIIGDVAWGEHFCVFYQSKQDLIDILVTYIKAGLENNEFCMWITSEPLNAKDAKESLKGTVRNLDSYIRKGQIEILDYSQWYPKSGKFETDRVLQGWIQKHDDAIARGFDGLRLTGNTFWLEKKDWAKFAEYEAMINKTIGKYHMIAICTYSLDKCDTSEILDVEHNHQFALFKWQGDWKILQSTTKNQLQARLTEQTAITQALERSKKDWVNTFNAISDWVVLMDLKRRILRTNPIGEEFVGVPVAEIEGQTCCKLLHGSDTPLPGCPLLKMLQSGHSEVAELQLPNSNRWLAITVDPVRDENGTFIGAVHITRDITERKKAEEALQASEERYRELFENAGEGIITLDLDGRITGANRLVEEYGFNRAELNGRQLFDFVPEHDKARSVSDFQALVAGSRVQGQMDIITPKGIITVEYRDTPIVRAGEVIGVQAILTDITERKRAEEALRESEEKFRNLAEKSPNMIFINKAGRIVYANQKSEDIMGYTQQEFCSPDFDFLSLISPEHTDLVRSSFNIHMTGEDVPPREYGLITKQGERIEALVATRLIQYDGQNAILGIVTDITERKRAEEALRESGEKFRSIFDNANDIIASVTKTGKILEVNKKIEDILGYKPDELIGKNFMTLGLLAAKNAAKMFHFFKESVKIGGFLVSRDGRNVTEVWVNHKDGHTVLLEANSTTIKEDGKLVGYLSVIRDITERKKAEEAYRSLVDHSLQGLAILQDECVVFTNQALADITGHTVEEMLVMTPEQVQAFVHPDDRELVWNRHRDRLNGEELPERYEFRGIRRDGSTCWLEIHASRIEFQGKPAIQAAYVDITERKKAEKALRKSEEHYRMLAETMNDGLGVIDEKGTYVYANNKLGEILGHSPDEIVGRHWKDFFDEDAQKIINEQLIERKKGIAEPYELKNTRKDGQKIFIRISPQAIFDEDGKFKGSIKIMTDITERKKAEEQIAKLAKFPAEDPNPVLRISGRGTVVYTNKASALLLKAWDCRVGKSLPDRWNELVMDSLSSGQNQQTEMKCDGRIFSLTFAPVVDANYVNVYGHDITERKKAEEDIRNLAKFPSEDPNVVFRISKQGGILYANRAGEILLSCRKCFENDKTASKEWLKLITEAFTSKSEKAFEFECKNRFYSFIIAPVAEGGYANFYGRDITKRKKAEDKLLEDQAKLKAMASEMLLTEERERQRLAVGLHDEVCQKLVLTKLALESSLQLVSDSNVLASLRIACEGIGETIEQADSLTFELSNPVLRQLGFVIALEKYLTEEIRQKYGIEYELEGDEQLSTLPDEIKNCLFRVTRELLTNVVKHAHARKVKVSARESQSQIYVRVQDDGVGFKESQADSKVSQTARFGLFSIREQLEYLGGHLEIESEPGRGTTATVVVPLRGKTTV